MSWSDKPEFQKAFIIKPDGSREPMPAPEGEGGTQFTLKQLQTAVGGYIEQVNPHPMSGFPEDRVALVNEEGLMKSLTVNNVASFMLGVGIVGPVAIIHRSEWS